MNFRHDDKVACAKPVRDPLERCPYIAVSAKDGTAITPKDKWDTHVLRVECAGGRHKIAFSGGEVTLARGASLLTDFTAVRCGP